MDKYNINHDPKCNLQRGSSSCAIFFLSRRSELNKRSLARQETSSFVPQRVLHQTISSSHLLQPLQQIGLYMKVLTMTSKATHHNWSLIDWTKSKNCHILPPPSLPHVIQLKTKKLQDLWNCSRSKILNNPRLKYLSLSASLNRIALKFTNIWRTNISPVVLQNLGKRNSLMRRYCWHMIWIPERKMLVKTKKYS